MLFRSDSNVKSVEISNSEEEYAKFLAENEGSDEIINILDDEMRALMFSKMQGTMRIKVYNVKYDISSLSEAQLLAREEENALDVSNISIGKST